jgi:hypothetical protein
MLPLVDCPTPCEVAVDPLNEDILVTLSCPPLVRINVGSWVQEPTGRLPWLRPTDVVRGILGGHVGWSVDVALPDPHRSHVLAVYVGVAFLFVNQSDWSSVREQAVGFVARSGYSAVIWRIFEDQIRVFQFRLFRHRCPSFPSSGQGPRVQGVLLTVGAITHLLPPFVPGIAPLLGCDDSCAAMSDPSLGEAHEATTLATES